MSFPGDSSFMLCSGHLDLQIQHILPEMFAFILTVIYNLQDTLQIPRALDLGVLIYGVR